MSRGFAVAITASLMIAALGAGCGSAAKRPASNAAAGTSTASEAGGSTETAAGTDTDATQTETDAGSDEGARTPCKKAATSKPTGLQAGFPIPAELTITAVGEQGPTNVLDGYWAADLDKVFDQYTARVTAAGYAILHREHDAHDAEINYKGSGHEGQIALHDDCAEDGTTRVHITNRPA